MSIRFSILTVSDRSARGERPDATGPALAQIIQAQGWLITEQAILPDESQAVRNWLVEQVSSGQVDVILTNGGTGFSPRDVTPEATLSIIERQAPGIVEAMRSASLKVTPHAMLSRAVAGIRGRTLIINLPGSTKGALENLETITQVLPHAVELLRDEPGVEAGHEIFRKP
jgi:molybdenum cofactor synthesis domain-containing protein